jgi:hypothetical protein
MGWPGGCGPAAVSGNRGRYSRDLLAGLMEEELNGIVVPYNGIYFRRI